MNQRANTVSTNEQQLVAFQLGEETYGIDIARVQEIIRLQQITEVPGAPDFVEGVINLRGRVIPVIDLRKRFALAKREDRKSARIIVVEVHPHTVGMIVDAVDEVLRITEDQIEPPSPLIASIEAEYIRGVGKLPDRLLVLLDLGKVLKKEEKAVLADVRGMDRA
ncbi:MAG TPA: chemotaxis protein CheW [Atribacteraceae bacterium]|nr:chemotaxis protein CheW [Atribacteraceae bacterium]